MYIAFARQHSGARAGYVKKAEGSRRDKDSMPKTPSNKLFRLIKSLSGPEKRYFKVFTGGQNGRDNKYLTLFDAIDAREAFDDEALRQEVYGDEPIQSRKYSELKAYLYNLILKSLQSYDEKSSASHRLKSMLQSVQVLFQRSLFDDCKDYLARAKKLAYQYEQFAIVLESLGWEKHIAYTETDIDFLDQELERIDAEEKEVLEKLRNISEYRNIFYRLLVSLRKDASLRGEAFRARLSGIIDSPLLQDYGLANSHQARVLYYRIASIYHYAVSDLEKFYQESKALIGLMESQPHLLQEDVSEYISAISNFIVSCARMDKLEELEAGLEKLRHIQPNSKDDELKIHRQYYQNKFSLCILKGDFGEGLRALQEHLRDRQHFDESLFETHTFYYNYFYISFGAEQYEQALGFLNKWLSLPNTIERQDLQGVARILNLIVHYELGNYELIESLLRSAYRFLKKRDKLHEVERKVMSFIRKAVEAPSKRELREAYESLREEFEDLSQQPLAKTFFTKAFDIMAWLKSKIEGKPFAEVIRQKFREQYPGLR